MLPSAVARWRILPWWRESLVRRADGSWLPQATSRNTESPKSGGADRASDRHLHSDGGGVSWTFRQGSAETSVAVGGRLKVTAAEGLREAVFAHLGIAITSEWNFAPELASGIVKAL